LSIIWSCIATKETILPATHVSPVHAVEGSAVEDNPLTSPVRVVQETQVNFICSSCAPFDKYKRPLVTVGATERERVVSHGDSFAESVDE